MDDLKSTCCKINDKLETPNKSLQLKEYEINLNKDTYKLTIEVFSQPSIIFTLNQTNVLSDIYYQKEYKYHEILNIMKISSQLYDDIKKIADFWDMAIAKNIVNLQEERPNKRMLLKFTTEIYFQKIETIIELIEHQKKPNELMKTILKEINNLKTNPQMNNPSNQIINTELEPQGIKKLEEEIKELTLYKEIEKKEAITEKEEINKKIQDMNNQMLLQSQENINLKILIENINKEVLNLTNENKAINEKLNNLCKIKDEMVNEIAKLKKENKNINQQLIQEKKNSESIKKELMKIKHLENENIQLQNKIDIIPFIGDPTNLHYKEEITNNIKGWGLLNNFEVYIGLKDNIEYMAYNNKINYNLDIMRINDRALINSLKGHKTGTNVIRYYIKDNKEEYIISCDKNNLVIVWDIQNNYNNQYNIQIKDFGTIWDSLLLFNIFNKNYILISSYNKDEFTKLYEFKDNTPFIKNIYGTNENNTAFMIPWMYKRNYYIIECCYYKIAINNLLNDECYANLSMNPEGKHCCGYIYNDNYLCVSDLDNNYIRIWDLVNKEMYKQINYDGIRGREIIPWNNKYAILGCEGGFDIIDLEEGKLLKKIKLDNTYVEGVKKIRGNKLGECIMISISDNLDNSYKIKLYSL